MWPPRLGASGGGAAAAYNPSPRLRHVGVAHVHKVVVLHPHPHLRVQRGLLVLELGVELRQLAAAVSVVPKL